MFEGPLLNGGSRRSTTVPTETPLVMQHKTPSVQPKVSHHMLNVNHLSSNGHQIRESPRISSQCKPRIISNITNSTPQYNQQCPKCELRWQGLLPKRSISKGNQKGSTRSKHDKRTDIGVSKKVCVCKNCKVKHKGSRNEFLGIVNGKSIIV